MITCRELIDFLDDYIDGTMSAPQRRAVHEHLRVCRDCVNYLNSYRATIALGRDAFADKHAPIPNDIPRELVRAMLAARGSTGAG
ncbi:hypothetical protein BH09PLA1_BH09PLA1_04980 [soil metagenome]